MSLPKPIFQSNNGFTWHRAKLLNVYNRNWNLSPYSTRLEVFLVDWGETRFVENVDKNVIFIGNSAIQNTPGLAKLVAVKCKLSSNILDFFESNQMFAATC